MYESILGSLIATVIAKVSKHAYEYFSQLAKRADNELRKAELIQLRDRICKEIENTTKVLTQAETLQWMGALWEKKRALTRIERFVQKAHGELSKSDTVETFVGLRTSYTERNLEEPLGILLDPLSPLMNISEENELRKTINAITLDIKQSLAFFIEKGVTTSITTCVESCIKLDRKLDDMIRLTITNA